MSASSCLHCGDELETWGVCGNVVPTLFCGNCCASFKQPIEDNSAMPHMVSKARALTYYGCTKSDLKDLHSGWTNGNRGETMQLYLAKEVDFVGWQRNLQRKIKLEEDLGVDLGSMEVLLRTYLLGDYLQRSNKRVTTLDEVRQRFGALDRVQAIVNEVHCADPGAAFDFAVRYANAGPVEFLDFKERCHQAFRIVGQKIIGLLDERGRRNLLQTPFKQEVIDYWKDQKMKEPS